jgi:hypothetical protein
MTGASSCGTRVPNHVHQKSRHSPRSEESLLVIRLTLTDFRMSAMPVGVLLKDARCANHCGVIARPCDKLQAHRKFFAGESAGNGKRRQPTEVSDSAQRIRKSQVGLKIGLERRGGNGLRGSSQNVEILEEVGHSLLHGRNLRRRFVR